MIMQFGSALGAWIGGYLHDLTRDYRAAFIFSAFSVLGAVSPFWYSKRLRDPSPLPYPPHKPERRSDA
jgi:predicted MFS family arabinose efflux permease